MLLNRSLFAALILGIVGVGGITPSAASAYEYKSEAVPVTLTGVQEKHNEGGVETTDRYTVQHGTFACDATTYTGVQSQSSATTLSLSPAVSQCTYAIAQITVDANECKYIFKFKGSSETGTTDISCPAGKEIRWTVGFEGVRGTVNFPSQTAKGGVYFANIGTGATREITVLIEIENLSYSQTGGTGPGALSTVALNEKGKYVGAFKLKGENASGTAHIGIWFA
jgi:hypothetical protein